MSRLSKIVRKYVKCPQLDGGIEYGEWGALRLDQRKQIAKLCEEVDLFEDAADKFGKEIQELKQQLAELQEKYGACQEARKLEAEFKNQEFMEHFQELVDMEKQLVEKEKEILDWKDGTIICIYEKMLAEKDKEIERLKAIDEWKENYGYSNYEDIYMLDDLQSRAFQSEDDAQIIDNLLDYFEISDENQIMTKINSIRKQICNEIREKIVEATCYDTEEEVRNVTYDLNASEVLGILDQIEKGE